MFGGRIRTLVALTLFGMLLFYPSGKADPESREMEPLRFVKVNVEDPAVTLGKYQPLLTKLSAYLGRKVELVQTTAYADVQPLFTSGKVDFGILNAFTYILISKESRLTPVVKRMVGKEGFYRCYIIANYKLNVQSLKDLKGKSFAFSESNSTSGYLLAKLLLLKNGIVAERDFSYVLSIVQHDSLILAVANKSVDAAAVASYVFDDYDKRVTGKTRIIEKSDPIPLGPIVVRHDLGSDLVEKIRIFFLTLHETEEGRSVLREAGLTRFAPAEDHDYDIIRKAAAFLEKEEKTP